MAVTPYQMPNLAAFNRPIADPNSQQKLQAYQNYVSGLLTDPMARAEFGTGLLQGTTTDLASLPVDVYSGAVNLAQAVTPQNAPQNRFFMTNPFYMLSQSGDLAEQASSVAGSEALGEAVYGKPQEGYAKYRDPARIVGGLTGGGELLLGKASAKVAPYIGDAVNYLTDAMPRPQVATPEGLLMDAPQQTPTQPQTLLMEGDNVPSATQSVDNVPIAEPAQVVPPTDENPVGIIAFHGSGADFDEFRLEKIGTGEGKQAYGYGLYFTDSEDIAKFYRDSVQYNQRMRGDALNINYQGEPFEYLGDTAAAEVAPPSYHAITSIADEMAKYLPANPKMAKPEKAKERLLARIDAEIEKYSKAGQSDADLGVVELKGGGTLEELLVTDLQQQKQALLDINSDDITPATGKMYKVGLEPKPEELLDYDKPIGNQSEDIKAKISKLVENEITADDLENFGMPRGDLKASLLSENRSVVSFLNDFAAIRGKDNAGEELLNKYGIKGIKFFSNSSRNTSGGELIDIVQDADGYRAKVAVDNRQGGLGGSGRIVTTSQPYKTEQEALDWANRSIDNKERNYVIFDDKLVKIMEKYGIPAGVSVTAVKGAMQDTDEGLLSKDQPQPQGLL